MIFLFIAFWGLLAQAGIYSDIPKTFSSSVAQTKELKFGYNLTNNLSQKQSLFFVEGNYKNNKLNHFTRYEIAGAKTEEGGVVSASTKSNLLRTNTIVPLREFARDGGSPLAIAGTLYGRSYKFRDNLSSGSDLDDSLATIGFGVSRVNIYTVGISIGGRSASMFFNDDAVRGNISEYVYRPSFVYTSKVEELIPRWLKRFLQKNSIYEFTTTETSIKFEYALIAGDCTYIQQFYAGIEKNISKHIAIAVFYDYEATKSTYSVFTNINSIGKISTSLVVKL